jgi:hypothetical protein
MSAQNLACTHAPNAWEALPTLFSCKTKRNTGPSLINKCLICSSHAARQRIRLNPTVKLQVPPAENRIRAALRSTSRLAHLRRQNTAWHYVCVPKTRLLRLCVCRGFGGGGDMQRLSRVVLLRTRPEQPWIWNESKWPGGGVCVRNTSAVSSRVPKISAGRYAH